MLRWMRVANVAVIDRLEMDFEPGLNLITGETGAGKSILIDALGLILGGRAHADLVRSGAASATVEAGFELEPFPDELARRLEAAGVPFEEGEIVIRREVAASGRGRVAVNGAAAAAFLLREAAPFLADIHGQGESSTLLAPDAGIAILDRLAGCEEPASQVAARYRRLRELEEKREELAREARDRDARRDLLAFELREIDEAAPSVGEDAALEDERRLLAHAEKLRTLAEVAYGALYEEDDSVLARLSQVGRQVSELAGIDARFAPYLETRAQAASQLEDLALFLRDYREQIRFTPGRLEEVEARLARLERLKKKHGGSLEAVLARREACRAQLADLGRTGERLDEVTAEIETTAGDYLARARALSQARRQAAAALEKRVTRELRRLAMEKARFAIEVSSEEETDGAAPRAGWRESGLDRVDFLFSANPGEELRPLARVASGGELSRFLLALKTVATRGELPKTLVFDEVDAGIGGRVADVVGGQLKELSRAHQVICVTHLPQIARFADAHFRIEKTAAGGRTETRVERLDREGRVNEIARMLAGTVVTETARRHAEQLVAEKT